MANGYPPAGAPDQPAAPSNNNGAAPAKQSQAQANYREGSPIPQER
jgi:hypothetical protein